MRSSFERTSFSNPNLYYWSEVLGVRGLMLDAEPSRRSSFGVFTYGEWSPDHEKLMNKILSSAQITEFQHFHNHSSQWREGQNFLCSLIFGFAQEDKKDATASNRVLKLSNLSSMLEGDPEKILENKKKTWKQLKSLLI